ncbi:c-type cytochrome [Congregibacter litoralis]|uniref:c-type cytochrome n=1 Tax=Congregibacter litoralis TaxID=393662 RepID=UPI00031421EB|nr:c-type cytochrome [Congregibacter litoralis]
MSFSASLYAADTAVGESLYAPCITCHGADGAGVAAMNAPALAGQDGDYLKRQLHHFKSGVRGNDPRDLFGKQMQGMAALLADETAVTNVVAYIGSLPAATTSAVTGHDQRNGEVQYNAACGACHGPGGKGNPSMNAPRLAGLDAAYLRRQYQNFAEGIRGSHEDDRLGRQMQMMATMLSTEKDLDDVIGYLLSQ